MSHSVAIEPTVISKIPSNVNGLTVLDVGIGMGFWGLILRSRVDGKCHLIGMDPYGPCVESLRKTGLYDELYVATGAEYLKENPSKRFHVILCCEVVEHIPKKEAWKMIDAMKKALYPDGVLIVTTPDGFSSGAAGFDGNNLNVHVCGYSAGEFRERGFSVVRVQKEGFYGRVPALFTKLYFLLVKGSKAVTHTLVASFYLRHQEV